MDQQRRKYFEMRNAENVWEYGFLYIFPVSEGRSLILTCWTTLWSRQSVCLVSLGGEFRVSDGSWGGLRQVVLGVPQAVNHSARRSG